MKSYTERRAQDVVQAQLSALIPQLTQAHREALKWATATPGTRSAAVRAVRTGVADRISHARETLTAALVALEALPTTTDERNT